MSYVFVFIRMFVLVSFIMLIVRGIFRDFHIIYQGLGFFLVSLAIFTISLISLIIDYGFENEITTYGLIKYAGILVTSIVYLIYGCLILAKRNQFAKKVKKKMVYTYKEKDEYVYILYRNDSIIYLLKDTNTGVQTKLKKNEYADDCINKINENLKVQVEWGLDRLGTVTVKGEKRDDVYYCYVIEISNVIEDDRFMWATNYDITTLDIPDFDKFIILKCLMGNEFNETY